MVPNEKVRVVPQIDKAMMKRQGEAAEPWRKCTKSTKWSEGRQRGETWRNHSNDIQMPTTKEKRLSLQTHQGRGKQNRDCLPVYEDELGDRKQA